MSKLINTIRKHFQQWREQRRQQREKRRLERRAYNGFWLNDWKD